LVLLCEHFLLLHGATKWWGVWGQGKQIGVATFIELYGGIQVLGIKQPLFIRFQPRNKGPSSTCVPRSSSRFKFKNSALWKNILMRCCLVAPADMPRAQKQPKGVRVAMRRFHAITLAYPRNLAAGNISGPDPGLQTRVPQVLRSEVEVNIDEPTQTSTFQGTTKPITH
jgi:hypothetical protein